MPAHSDHIRRDAEHAARCEIAILIQKYVRRLNEEAKAHIQSALNDPGADSLPIDGTALGREAASAALHSYLGLEEVREPVEALPPAA